MLCEKCGLMPQHCICFLSPPEASNIDRLRVLDAIKYGPTSHFAPEADPINRPSHYTSHPSGVECITITEHLPFNVGNAIKYLWRASLKKATPEEDLRKALWYVARELKRLGYDK